MTGRLKEATALFEQGIQADPAYPLFHYNLACTFADMNELDHTMQSLRTAFAIEKISTLTTRECPTHARACLSSAS